MVVTILDGDVARMEALAPKSVDILVFITRDRLTPARVKKLTPIAARAIAPGGAAYIAESIADVFERL